MIYVESTQATATAETEELNEMYSEIGGLLEVTLNVDSFVDIKQLKRRKSMHMALTSQPRSPGLCWLHLNLNT